MTAPPRLAPSLATLRREIDGRFPNRDTRSDGWIGDAAHAGRHSDHNPDDRGIVHALDITAHSIGAWPIVVAMTHHPSTHYVIFRGVLFSRTHDFRPVVYHGADPHDTHIHVSIRLTRPAENSRVLWLGGHL